MFAMFRSMHGRLFLILLVGMLVTAAGTMLLTHARQQEMFEHVRAQHLASEIADAGGDAGKDHRRRSAMISCMHRTAWVYTGI